MPENLPPSGWGPASSDERDLDAVLAGHLADVPDALLPVADVLAALGAAPAPDELRGEARVMAEFRAHGPGGVASPIEPAPTRPLLALPADPSPRRRSVRHRTRRQGSRPGGRAVSHWAGALTGVAAAAAIVVAVAFTGSLPAPIERLAHLGQATAKPSAPSASTHSVAPKTEPTSAPAEPTTPPPATHSTESAQQYARTTCRDYYGDYYADFGHPASASRTSAEKSLWRELTQLVNSNSRQRVDSFCAPYLSGIFPPASQHTSSGDQTGSQGSDQQGSQNTAGAPNESQGRQPSSGAAAPALTPSTPR